MEIYVSTPLAECERRDVKGLYARARAGEVKNFTGLDDPYEPPTRPALIIDTRTSPWPRPPSWCSSWYGRTGEWRAGDSASETRASAINLFPVLSFGHRSPVFHGPSRPTRRQERPHPARSLRQLQEPLHALVDRQGQHRPALAGPQGVLRPCAVSAGAHRHLLQDSRR